MSDPSERYGGAGIIELTGKIMVVAIVLLLFVVVFVFCLHLYAKYFWYRRRENPNSTFAATRRRRLDFASSHHEIAVPRRGLEPSFLKTLPILIFDQKQFEDGLECAVCLSDISQGEETRILPKCSHGFHLDCIDMWFESHSTCPLCRNPVKIQNPGDERPVEAPIQAPVAVNPIDAPNFPTNVFIWGDETQISTSTISVDENNHDQDNNAIIIVVEPSSSGSSISSTSGTPDGITSTVDAIPRQVNEEVDEQKSTLPTRLGSLKKKLLSYNNRRVNTSGSRNLDLEQGDRGQG